MASLPNRFAAPDFEGDDFKTYWTTLLRPRHGLNRRRRFPERQKRVSLPVTGGRAGIRQGRVYHAKRATNTTARSGSQRRGRLARIDPSHAGAQRRQIASVPSALRKSASAWHEVPFSFASPVRDTQAQSRSLPYGTGAVLVDFISLMRADVRARRQAPPGPARRAASDLTPAFIRWPGGSYASIYKWKDGIGPAVKRNYNPNTFWGDYSDYYGFGTDEFLELCRQLVREPLIVLAATGTDPAQLEYAMDWVHYLLDPPTPNGADTAPPTAIPSPTKSPTSRSTTSP